MTHSAIILSARGLCVGDLVEVRSADEIIATLDERGELENLPFMPEMLKFCGQRLTVDKWRTSCATPCTAAAFTKWRTRCT